MCNSSIKAYQLLGNSSKSFGGFKTITPPSEFSSFKLEEEEEEDIEEGY